MDSFLAQLTPRIQADLPAWYGSGAETAGAPTAFQRNWSYFFRYAVQTSGVNHKAVLVKVRHAENMSLTQAIASEKMRQEAGEEYKSLLHLRSIFGGQENSSLFSSIRPLALYENLNAVIMEEADVRNLRSCFRSPKMLAEGRTRKMFERYLELAGCWLRIFHDGSNGAGEGPLFDASLYENACENLAGIKSGISQKDRSALGALLDRLYKIHEGEVILYRVLHDDFNCANIFLTKDGKMCSFDPKNTPGSPYMDLTKIMVDLETCRIQVATNGLWIPYPRLRTFHAALLRGYFDSESVDQSALSLFRFLSLLDKWRDAEATFESSAGGERILYSLGMPHMRRYFLRLIHNLGNENFQGV